MKDAFFADPVGIVSCPKSTQAQLIGLAKVCHPLHRCTLLITHESPALPSREGEYPKVSSTREPSLSQGTLLVDQDVAYPLQCFPVIPSKASNDIAFAIMQSWSCYFLQIMDSLLSLELDSEGRLRHHAEYWNPDSETSSISQDGFLRTVFKHTKKFSLSTQTRFLAANSEMSRSSVGVCDLHDECCRCRVVSRHTIYIIYSSKFELHVKSMPAPCPSLYASSRQAASSRIACPSDHVQTF
jgi:hypothetical protein